MKKEIKNLLIVTFCVIIFLVIVYLIIAFKKGEIGNSNNNISSNENGLSLSYSNLINAESVFTRQEDSYYVMFFSEKNSIDAIKQVLTSYSGDIKLYKVNLDEPINKYVLGNSDNKDAQNSSELRVSKTTLIKISNKKIVSYINDSVEIINELK